MEIRQQLRRQRVKHIVSSYQLGGDAANQFDLYLEDLLQAYPSPLIELALVETLVRNWLSVPMTRGVEFLKQVHQQLTTWETQPITSMITPGQFQQITGLDPSPIFGNTDLSATQPTVQPFS